MQLFPTGVNEINETTCFSQEAEILSSGEAKTPTHIHVIHVICTVSYISLKLNIKLPQRRSRVD